MYLKAVEPVSLKVISKNTLGTAFFFLRDLMTVIARSKLSANFY
ncbi:hypothetical protein [Algoriphagus sanaruensis]|nr:hypothetical protein [Algoriphagus sanaruensis]